MMTERVAIIGAGVAGLCAALSLTGQGREIVILERDPPPPDGGVDAVFDAWARGGVTHLRHSHAFLARLRNIFNARCPDLLARMVDAGVRELPFENVLSPQLRAAYAPIPADADLTILTSRRTTLEFVMRAYVEGLSDVTIRTGALVRQILLDAGAKPLRAIGVRCAIGDVTEDVNADFVIDASGRMGGGRDQLTAAGADIREEAESAGILYFTQHYRLRAGQGEPERNANAPANGDLGYLKFGVFPGDNGCFSVTLALPEVETAMRKAVLRSETFQAVTQLLPGLASWTDPARAEQVSRVFAMGDLRSIWWDFAPDEAPAALNYFAIGDAHVRTNPLYGRGCSFAAVAAEALRATLAENSDPAARACAYEARLRRDVRPFFDDMRNQDRSAIRRARHALNPAYRPRWKSRVLRSFVEDGVAIALRRDIGLMRDAMRAFHMIDPPNAWLRDPAKLARVLLVWARGKRANAAFYASKPGPDRATLLAALGVDARADLIAA